MMSIMALIGLLGFFACKQRNEQLGAFYLICPVLLLVAFLTFLNLWDLVHAILHYEGVI